MPLDPGTADLLALIEAAPYPPMHESTPELARKAFRAMTCDLVGPDQVVPVASVEEVDAGGRPARVYRPDGPAADRPTLVYLHGGGWVIGDLDTHDQTCRRLCVGADVVVVSVDYRLSPEAVFPAALDDALAAVRWAAEHRADLGGGPLAVGGDSAGGNLAAVAAQQLPDLVAAQVLVYPATDMAGDHPSRTENAEGYFLDLATMTWFAGHYLGPDAAGLDLADPRLSPFHGELAGVAPALVVTAEFDPLRDEGETYAERLAAAGVPVDRVRHDGLVHGFLDMGAISPAAAAAVDDLVARTRRLLHG